jgi:trypsin
VPVKRVIVHPDYLFPDDPSYDVALLELAEPVDLPTVKIANENETSLWEPGTLATIAGFGRTKEGGSQPPVLQEAQVPITTDEYAKKAYPNSFENLTQIGAGFEEGGVDTCQGDSGGPLLVPAGDTFRLVGDTSYGRGCARPGFPGIYGRLADTTLREWIRSIAPDAIAPTSSTSTSTKTKRGKGAQRKEAAQQRRGGSGSGSDSSSVGLR